jgi:hypothetical protein
MTSESGTRVAVIAGAFQVVVAVVGLFGTLATASERSSTAPLNGASTTIANMPAAGTSCTSIYREYRILILDPKLATSLTTPGADGTAPIDVDADARRCGIDRGALGAMR